MIETTPSFPPDTLPVSITVAVPPVVVSASLYVTVTVSPACVAIEPLSSASAVVPNTVGSEAVKTPVLIPVSDSVIDSLSPVTSLTTFTPTVSAAAGLLSRSPSSTETRSESPGMLLFEISTTPEIPPPTALTSVRVAVQPVLVNPSA